MMKAVRLLTGVLAILTLVVVWAWGQTAPKGGSQLVLAQLQNPSTLDGWNSTGSSDIDIVGHFVQPLWTHDRQGKLQGVVVESWKMIAPTEWVLNIRKGMKFHDRDLGELTAEDVKASFEASIREGTTLRTLYPPPMRASQIEIEGPYTIRWKMPAPGLATLPKYAVESYITSKKYLDRVGVDKFKLRPVGTGPYRFVEWVPNVRVVGEVFREYWGPLPLYDRVVWRIIPDAFTRKSELMTGGVDVLSFVEPEMVPELQAQPNIRIERTLSSRMIFIVLPVKNPLLGDRRVRQALNLAVNKEEIIQKLFGGTGAAALEAPVPVIMPERHPGLKGYPYDPAKARQLLRDAGVLGKTVVLEAPSNRYTLDRQIGEAVASYWEAVGLKVEYKPQEWGAFSPPALRGVPQYKENPFLIGFGDLHYLTDSLFDLWIQKKPGGSRGLEYTKGPDQWDQWITEVGALAADNPRRLELLNKLQEEVLEFAPWVWLINYVDIYAMNSKVDWKPYPHEVRYMWDAKPR